MAALVDKGNIGNWLELQQVNCACSVSSVQSSTMTPPSDWSSVCAGCEQPVVLPLTSDEQR